MVQSEMYYMITINQSPDCTVPYADVKAGLLKYAKSKANRALLAEEEGSQNGKAHLHLCVELFKEARKDNVVRAVQSHTKVLKTKNSIDVRGTRKTPHKENWEMFAIDYVAKDCKYETHNITQEFIDKQITQRIIKDYVEQKSVYIDKPKFWKLYREEIYLNRERYIQDYKDLHPDTEKTDRDIQASWYKCDNECIRHECMERILSIYTPLWLKPDFTMKVIEYQEGLVQYEPTIRSIVELHLENKKPVLEVEIIKRL